MNKYFKGTRSMGLRLSAVFAVGCALALAISAVTVAFAATDTFSNTGAITVPNVISPASPYPSTIAVSGVVGTITDVNVTLHGVGHSRPDDFDILLVGPLGHNVMLVSDACGGETVSGLNWTFDDEAAGTLPDTTAAGAGCTSGTYQPVDYTTDDTLPAPAPARPYGTALSVFDGTVANGTWSLYVYDDREGSLGGITGGWSLTIESTDPVNGEEPGNGEVPGDGNGVTPPPGPAPVVAVPGPDLIEIPEWATGGKILDWTPVYYLPVQGAVSSIELAPGTSIWVFGLDESRTFYLGMLAGKTFWLPVGVVGPNYDEVWQGRPLPTEIVEG